MSNILLGVTGSISAYKSADIVSKLKTLGHNVQVIMTEAGASFITPLTMEALSGKRVFVDVLKEDNPSQIAHVALANEADIFIVVPATANIIGKLANGIADDMLTSTALVVHDIPKFFAPAMNVNMYENIAVQENINTLTKRGWIEIKPRVGRLACDVIGMGALATTDTIITVIVDMLERSKDI